LLAVALLVLRRRGLARQYSLPAAAILAPLFALSSFAIVIATLIAEPRDAMIGLSLVLLGIPFYYLRRRQPLTSDL
jgi:basic amino acid/polyamine antiporter, APA family